MPSHIDIFIRKTKNAKYDTNYGIAFECVELIRRTFCTLTGYTYPDVVDAVDFFNKIHELPPLAGETAGKPPIPLQTYSYPYTRAWSYYFKPGSILFWKYKKTVFPYGHVALVIDSNENETTIIQQNLNPPVKVFNTKELMEKMNSPTSKFLGIKTIPPEISKKIKNVEYSIIRL